jgi:two-component system, NtrC family, nitrogen regulation sensor histidine kinase NtrY
MEATSAMQPKNLGCPGERYTGEWKPMVFKNFRFQVIIRVTVLTLSIILLAWCLAEERYLRSIYIAVGVVLLVAEFIWYADRFNRDIKTFLISLHQRDFTTHFEAAGRGRSFDELYEMLNKISGIFKTISSEKETQYRYLEMLVEHVRVGVLSMDADGRIYLANQAMKSLLQKEVLTGLKSLESLDTSLTHALQHIRTGETKLLRVKVNNDLLQLSIHASEFKLNEKYYKLISMQNIRNELDAREMEAWSKLIRVLSHEIMNSVAPIISLSGTMHELVSKKMGTPLAETEVNTLNQGLDAIRVRSEGLYNFTQSYRKLTGIPKLNVKKTNLKDLLGRVKTLLDTKLDENHVRFDMENVQGEIIADPELMEHVFINLILNAVEALEGKTGKVIEVKTTSDSKGNVSIHVIDNGEGMDERTAEKIFIPFFTTRKAGSGIGLALTKQILQLHNADIRFNTEKGKGTEFIVTW